MKHIIVAYDGSPASDAALHDLVHAALPEQLDVTVLSVADVYLPPDPKDTAGAGPHATPSVVFQAREKARKQVDAHRSLADRACARLTNTFPRWNCTPLAVADSPGWTIIKHASERKADLIVVGAKSHSRLEHFFLGSVAQKVIAEASCSVRVARHVEDGTALRVVIALDGSPDAHAALQSVAARPWRPGTEFHLVTVIDPRLETAIGSPGLVPQQFVQASDKTGREWVGRMMQAATDQLSKAGFKTSIHTREGDPKETLVRVSHELKAHAIFIGARGLHHGRKLYLGTAAYSIATQARCSVEIVRVNL